MWLLQIMVLVGEVFTTCISTTYNLLLWVMPHVWHIQCFCLKEFFGGAALSILLI